MHLGPKRIARSYSGNLTMTKLLSNDMHTHFDNRELNIYFVVEINETQWLQINTVWRWFKKLKMTLIQCIKFGKNTHYM